MLFAWLPPIAAAGTVPWHLPGWRHRAELIVDASALGSPEADLPVRVHLAADAPPGMDLADTVGPDLQLVDATGDLLAFDLDHYDPATSADLWVRLSLDPALPNPSIWLYWGNPQAVDAADPDGTWTPSGSVAVWYLEDCDATCPSAVGTATLDLDSVTTADGLAGDGIVAAGGDVSWDLSGRLSVPYSLSLWVKPESSPILEGLAGTTEWSLATCGDASVGFATQSVAQSCGSPPLATEAWHHVLWVAEDAYGNTQYTVYVDGQHDTATFVPAPAVVPTHIDWGSAPSVGVYAPFSGTIDQIQARLGSATQLRARDEWLAGSAALVSFGVVEEEIDGGSGGGFAPPDSGVTPPTDTGGETVTTTAWGGSAPPTAPGDSGVAGIDSAAVDPGSVAPVELIGGRCGCDSGGAGLPALGLALLLAVARRRPSE